MKSWRRSLLVALVFLCTTATALAGCSGGGEKTTDGAAPKAESKSETKEGSGSASEPFQLGSAPVDFTFYGHYDWYTMPNWGGDVASKWIQDNKKVNVTAINSGGNAAQKLNTMIASKELPDVIWMERGADVERLRAAGMLVPYED